MAKCKLTDLKRYLSNKNDSELKDEILELFKLYPNIKDYYSVKINSGNEEELLQKYKKIVKNEFFPDRGFGKLRFAILKQAISDFIKISRIPSNVADLLVYYVELGVDYTDSFGYMDDRFYNNLISVYEKALDYVSKEGLEEIFRERLREIMDKGDSRIAWGFSEDLGELYYSYIDD